MRPTKALPLVVATVCAGWPISGVLAADAPTDTDQLQLVTVTAEKRVEDVLKVPVSVSVLTREEMENRSIQDMGDVAAVTPGVDYQNLGGVDHIAIRGITTATNAAEYSTVGLYIDDIPIQVRASNLINLYGTALPKVFDLDRVEVLRGPQGTLYGAGAEGGAIRFITPQPSLTETTGYSRASLGVTDGGAPSYELGSAVGGPIVPDELGFRVSAWYRRDGGYIQYDSPLGGYKEDNGNWSDSSVVHAAMTYAPAESVRITPSFFYQDVYTNNIGSFEPAGSLAANDYYTSHWGVLNPQYSNVSNGYFVNPSTVQTPSEDNLSLPSVKIEWSPGAVDLISNTSYMYRRNSVIDDFTAFAQDFYGFPGWTTDPGAAVGDRNGITTNQNVFSQETRLQSADSKQPLQWTVGVYYADARQTVVNTETNPFIADIIQNFTGMTVQQYTSVPLIQPGNIEYLASEEEKDEQTALFGQGSYQIANQWTVIAGARVARESDTYSAYQVGPELFEPGFGFGGAQSQTVVDPKFGINYQLNADNLIYLSAAKGDRIGGVNASLALGPPCAAALAALGGAGTTYKGDSLWSYEIGSKNKLDDDRATIEASAFYIDWRNVQYAVPVPACASSFVTNLGEATSYGFDFQATALITEALEVGVAVGYTHATISSSIPIANNQKQAATQGDQLNPYAAPWLVSPTAQYTLALGESSKGYVRLDDVFHSKNPGPFAEEDAESVSYNAAFRPNPAYNLLNSHVGVTRGGWDVSVYALNLLNTHPILFNSQYYKIQPTGAAFTVTPLTVGVTAEYRW